MMNSNNNVEHLGKRNINLVVLIHLKKEIREEIVFVLRAKTLIQKVHLKENLFKAQKNFFAIKIRNDPENLDELASLKNQVEDLRLQGKLSKQNFNENMEFLDEPLTDTIKNTSEK